MNRWDSVKHVLTLQKVIRQTTYFIRFDLSHKSKGYDLIEDYVGYNLVK